MTEAARSPNAEPWDAGVQQAVFRQLMQAFSYPGCTAELGAGAPLAVLATLVDAESALADPQGLLAAADWPRLGCPRAEPTAAPFVLTDAGRAPEFVPALGDLAHPHRGATVVLRVARLGAGTRLLLSGPGVNGRATLQVAGLDPAWLAAREAWNARFPLGCDWILVDETQAAALPRTTRVTGHAVNGGRT